jgi:hypothetical protein
MADSFRRLGFEQRVAGVGALLLIISTFGPFSFVEAAEILTAVAVLALLKQRADRRQFHLPFGDGTVILAAAIWSALLIVARLFDRPLGQSVLALGCALILAAAGARERTRRPPDDLAPPPEPRVPAPSAPAAPRRAPSPADAPTTRMGDEDVTRRLPADDQDVTRRLPAEDEGGSAPG